MSIPVYRHNLDYDDWEVASVYNSDDCDSLGRSADDESLHSGYFDDPAPRSGLPGVVHDDVRRRIEYPMVVPMTPQPQLQPQQQKQHENYSPMTYVHSPRRWETRPVLAGKGSGYTSPPAPIVPPPGVIFPRQDWVHSPPQPKQDAAYWHSPTPTLTPTPTGHGHYGMPSSVHPDSLPVYQAPPMPPPPPVADVPVGLDRMDRVELSPPASSLLLAPSSPPPSAPCGLMKWPSPSTIIGHGQVPHATSLTVPGVQNPGIGVGSSSVSMNTYTAPSPPPPPAPMMPPPPRYHEVAHHHHHNHHHAMPIPMSPRCLAEAGCQARSRSSSQSQSQSHTQSHTQSSHTHPGMGTRSSSPNPRRQIVHGEHDLSSAYIAAGVPPRGRRSSEDMDMIGVPPDGRYAGSGNYASHSPAGDRSDLHATASMPIQGKYEREYDSARKTRPLTRERRPSIWQRFVRRFSPSRASIGQT